MQHRQRSRWLDGVRQDFVYAARMLGKSPAFTALAAGILALGLGGSIAVYALFEALLLRSLPFAEPHRLVSLAGVHERLGTVKFVAQENFRDWMAANTVFESMAFSGRFQATILGRGEPEVVTGSEVSENFFEMFAVQPMFGGWFRKEDQKPGGACVVLVSESFWRRKLEARPDVVGAALRFDDRFCRIEGVMPEKFALREGYVAEFWMPVRQVIRGRVQQQYRANARLKPGVELAAAQAQMSEIAARMARTYPENAGWGVQVASMREELLREVGEPLPVLAAAALIVLLVACGNVTCLLLARGIERSKEIGVRVALGASPGRVVRLLIAEGLLLSMLSAAGAGAVAAGLIRLAIAASPPSHGLGSMISISGTLVLFAVALVLLAGMVPSLYAGLRTAARESGLGLRESGGAMVHGRGQVRSLHALVVAEMALAVVLLSMAGLLIRSFVNLRGNDLGYRPEGVVTFKTALPASRYPAVAARVRFWDTLLAQLAAIPGVQSAAGSDSIPLGMTYAAAPVQVEGEDGRPSGIVTRGAVVTPDYFRTLGIEVRAGRTFDDGDLGTAAPVAVVNEAFVRKMPQGRPAVGTQLRFAQRSLRIAGVIADSRYFGPARAPEPEVYVPHTQFPMLQFVSIRASVPEAAVLAATREVIRRLDPELPITQVRTLRQSVDGAMTFQRDMMLLVGGFAAVTVAMAATGLGGVMIYVVSRRRREIGLRMALGAERGQIAWTVLSRTLRLALGGGLLGAAAALASGRLIGSFLHGVGANDPVTVLLAPAVLIAIAVLTGAVPALRAASVDPLAAIRQEH